MAGKLTLGITSCPCGHTRIDILPPHFVEPRPCEPNEPLPPFAVATPTASASTAQHAKRVRSLMYLPPSPYIGPPEGGRRTLRLRTGAVHPGSRSMATGE